MYHSGFCVYPNVFHPRLRIHTEYIQNTPGYIKHNVSLSQTTGYKNTLQNTSEYTKIQYSRRIHQNTSEYIRILYSFIENAPKSHRKRTQTRRAGEQRPRLVGREGGACCVCVCLTRGALPCSFVRAHHHPLRRRDASAVSCVQITIPFEVMCP